MFLKSFQKNRSIFTRLQQSEKHTQDVTSQAIEQQEAKRSLNKYRHYQPIKHKHE